MVAFSIYSGEILEITEDGWTAYLKIRLIWLHYFIFGLLLNDPIDLLSSHSGTRLFSVRKQQHLLYSI